MTRTPRVLLLGPLLLLLLCSTACLTRTVQVPVVQPAPSCPLPPLPSFPTLSATTCLDATGEEAVCLTPAVTVQVWQWVRDVSRWRDLATVCLDAR